MHRLEVILDVALTHVFEVTIETSGDVARASILRGTQTPPLERLDAHHFRAELALNEPGEYKVRLQEANGTSAEVGPFPINVLPDAPPTAHGFA